MNFKHDELLSSLVKEFLAEPFAKSKNFFNKNLESICTEMELAHAYPGPQLESFERARDLLCLILSQLELLGLEEMPEGQFGNWPGPSKSRFLKAADFFQRLKQNGQTDLDGDHLDRLIGQHLCLELEEQANVFLEPIFKRAFPRHQRFFPLEQISALVLALDLDKKLAEQLESMIEKKKEAFNWGKEISDSWLVDLNQSFLSARESLQRLFETNEETSQAA